MDAQEYDVFISYAREDRKHVKQLAEALASSRGWSVWWDDRLAVGGDFSREIEGVLTNAGCILVIWSSNSVDSDWVRAEATEGWRIGNLVPVLIQECDPPIPFRQIEAADLVNWNGSEDSPFFLKMVGSIESVLEQGVTKAAFDFKRREARRRRVRHRRLVRRLAVGGIAVAAALACLIFYKAYHARQTTLRFVKELSAQADELRIEFIENYAESNKTWWAFLYREQNLDRLQLFGLLAVEARKRADTEQTNQLLRKAIALLPGSAQQYLEIEISDKPSRIGFSFDGIFLAAGGGKGDTIIWDLNSDEISARLPHGGTGGLDRWSDKRGNFVVRPTDVVQFSPSKNVLATAGPDHTARLWEASSGRELLRLAHDSIVTVVKFGPRGDVVATATEGGSVHLWNLESGEEIHQMKHEDAVYGLDVSASGRYLASASIDRTTRVWTLESGTEVTRITHDGPARTAVFSPDEALIATATTGRLMKTIIWQVKTGAEVWRLPIGTDSRELVFGPKGRILVTGGYEGLWWWDLQAKAPRHSVLNSPEAKWVGNLVLTRDGKYIAAKTTDGTVRVWDFETSREVKRIPYYRWEMDIAVSPDDNLLASTGHNGSQMAIEIFEIRQDASTETACRRLPRNLSEKEWRQYIGLEAYTPTCPGK